MVLKQQPCRRGRDRGGGVGIIGKTRKGGGMPLNRLPPPCVGTPGGSLRMRFLPTVCMVGLGDFLTTRYQAQSTSVASENDIFKMRGAVVFVAFFQF